MIRRLVAMLGASAGFLGIAHAADEAPPPELDFLEYLGSWQPEDEEWVIEAGWEDEDDTPPADGKQEPEAESEETNDEA